MDSYYRRQAPLWDADLYALERARILAGLSYRRLALELPIHRTYLADILRGRKGTSLRIMREIVRVLGVDSKDIIRFRPVPFPTSPGRPMSQGTVDQRSAPSAPAPQLGQSKSRPPRPLLAPALPCEPPAPD